MNFIESYNNSEMRITLADASEEVIESHAVDQIRAAKSRSRFLPDLQKLIEGVDFVRSEFKLKQPPTLYSSTPLTSEISMVGFDEVLVQRLDLLTREHSRRSVIHIVGMGEIGKTTLGIGKTTLARIYF